MIIFRKIGSLTGKQNWKSPVENNNHCFLEKVDERRIGRIILVNGCMCTIISTLLFFYNSFAPNFWVIWWRLYHRSDDLRKVLDVILIIGSCIWWLSFLFRPLSCNWPQREPDPNMHWSQPWNSIQSQFSNQTYFITRSMQILTRLTE